MPHCDNWKGFDIGYLGSGTRIANTFTDTDRKSFIGDKTMARAWFSYVVFAIGMMMLVASDKQSIADNKQESENVFTFADTKDVHVFVNKMGDDDAKVDVMINGKKHTFTIPELLSGQTKNLTTEDGTEITVKALEGKQVVWVVCHILETLEIKVRALTC